MNIVSPTIREAEDPGEIVTLIEKYFSVKEVAGQLGFSENTIINLFRDEPGVIKLRRGLGRKRDYVTLRIPASVLRRFIENRSR